MDRFKNKNSAESVNRLIREARKTSGNGIAGHLAGLTPAHLARLEQAAATLTPAQLQGALSRAFASLDPATLAQIADKLAASGLSAPAGQRTDPATLSVLAATAMRGRIGGIVSLLMILAGTRLSQHARAMAAGQPANSGLIAARNVARQLLTTMLSGETAESVANPPTRTRVGFAQMQQLAGLAKSPLVRQVMREFGPALLKTANMSSSSSSAGNKTDGVS